MQFQTSALLLLLATSVTAIEIDINSGIDNLQSKVSDLQGAASTILSDVQGGASSVVSDLKGEISTFASDVKSFVTSVEDKIHLPTITMTPPNVEGYFSTVEGDLKTLPKSEWDAIKTGLYPTEVSQWVDSLPTQMRAEASNKLTEWANDMGSGAPANSNSRGALALAALGAGGVLALALAL